MSATSLTLARAIPPSLPLRHRLPTRSPQPFLSIRCHGTTPFHRTPTLHLWSRAEHFAKKAAGGAKHPAKFDSLVPKKDRTGMRNGTRPTNSFPKNQWTGQQDRDYAFKTLDLKSNVKAGMEMEGASEVDDQEPTVVDWGDLSEEPPKPVEVASEVDVDEGEREDRSEPDPPKDQTERELRSAVRKKKKIAKLMASLEKMNRETQDFKTAKKGKVLYDLAAVDPEAASLPPPELPTHDEALRKIESLVELQPCAQRREKQITEYLRHWDENRPNLKAPTREEHAKLYQEEFLRVQTEFGVTPGSLESKLDIAAHEQVEAHMRAWNLVNRPRGVDDDGPKEPRDQRRHRKLYAKELAKFQKKHGVEPGSDEHKEMIELHMQSWEARRQAQVEKIERMRETKKERKVAQAAAQKERRKAKMQAKQEKKKINDRRSQNRDFQGDSEFNSRFAQGLFIKAPSP